jgi:serine/threonine-protein kinase RsbW/stage II sporulation protein AB (anti-sigma F factor)
VVGTFAARPDGVAEARRQVTRWLRGEMPSAEVMIGDVALAVSEACTNVVMHAYANGDGGFRVTTERDGDSVLVTVSDEGDGMVPRPDSPGLGLGLPLIATLADSLEIRPADGGGTVVAMTFSAARAETRAA